MPWQGGTKRPGSRVREAGSSKRQAWQIVVTTEA